MGILGRINRVIKANVNDLVDRMSDPGKEIDLMIEDMEQGLKKAREEVISTTATAKRHKMQRDRQVEEVKTWQGRAETAVRASDDDLAREALRQRSAAQEALDTADRALGEQEAYVAELKQSLKALEERLKDVKLRKNTLKQRARAAKEGKSPTDLGGKAFSDFDRLESKIEAMEEAQEFSSSLDGEVATAAKFSQLEAEQGNPELDDDLAALKRKMEEGE